MPQQSHHNQSQQAVDWKELKTKVRTREFNICDQNGTHAFFPWLYCSKERRGRLVMIVAVSALSQDRGGLLVHLVFLVTMQLTPKLFCAHFQVQFFNDLINF